MSLASNSGNGHFGRPNPIVLRPSRTSNDFVVSHNWGSPREEFRDVRPEFVPMFREVHFSTRYS